MGDAGPSSPWRRFQAGFASGRGAHPEQPAWPLRRRLRNGLRLLRWGHRQVIWLAGSDGQVPGSDRPWQAGDRFEVRTAAGKLLMRARARGIDRQLADDLNWAFRWV